MSIKNVSHSQIECDSCGQTRIGPELDATAARIAAAQEGWHYVAWNIKGLQKRVPDTRPGRDGSFSVQTVPRQWDCCPDCQLPESPEAAAKIRSERKVCVHGQWKDRQES